MTEVYRHTLPNGLRVVVHPDRTTAMVALDIMYNVGARDENPNLTGMAHLFEHLMFGGSANVPDFDREVERAGGINNAWTSNDFTNFYTVVPAINAATAFWVESDRMLAPRLTGRVLEVQRDVVVEEFKQVCLNQPYGDLYHHLRALAYKTHPYRYPTLGITPEHVASVTDADVEAFFNDHYAPNNAVLVVSGNIEPDRAFELADKYFGSIPRKDVKPRLYAPEPLIEAPRRLEVKGRVPHTILTMAFPMAAFNAPGYVEADIITDILANGRASRLISEVVMSDGVVSNADASIIGSDEPGLLMINATLKGNSAADVEEGEAIIRSQLERLRTDEVGADELRRCTARFASTIAFGRLSYLGIAEELAQAEIQGSDIDTRVDSYREVDAPRLRSVAKKILDPTHGVTLIYSPE